ncbi:MAG: hypothetical protein RR800_00325 [Comamonas sp.]
MTALKISSFVGEAPSLSGRGLAGSFARHNHNLYLAANDFRPLQGDKVHSACPPGTLTLYRFHRNALGQVVPDPLAPLLAYPERRSLAKGQVNDEATERTYMTFDLGEQAPRVINIQGDNRLLGVARPRAPELVANVVDEFTPDEAKTWLYGEFVEALQARIVSASPARSSDSAAIRFNGEGVAYAGAAQSYGLKTVVQLARPDLNVGMLYAEVTDARAAAQAMNMTLLQATKTGTGWLVPVSAMPMAYPLNGVALQAALQLLEFPAGSGEQSGSAVLTEAQAGQLVELAAAATAPGTTCEKWRAELGALLAEFSNLALVKWWDSAGEPPVKPSQPKLPRWITGGGDSTGLVENSDWTIHDKALDEYYTALDAYNKGERGVSSQVDSLNSRMLEVQARCTALVASIEGQLARQWTAATDDNKAASAWMDKLGGVTKLASTAGVRTVDSRFYVVAMVTDWGEESEPSPISAMVEVDANDTVLVTRPGLLTGEVYTARHIVKWRLYRSNTGQAGAAWQLVKEMGIDVPQFLDDVASSELDSLQPQFNWAAPPYRQDGQHEGEVKPVIGANPYLRNLASLANGIMAGFIDNMVAFCEPYVPYAWPVAYQVKTEFPIVAMAGADSYLVVLTTGNPYVITGAHSSAMSAQQLAYAYPCAAARSVCAVSGGVLYACPTGICFVQGQDVKLITQTYFTREQWQDMNPAGMHAVEHGGVYYLFYDGLAGPGCVVVSVEGGAFKIGSCDLRGVAAWSDKFNDALYLVRGGQVWQCLTERARKVGRWRSGTSTLPKQEALAWVKVYGDQSPDAPITVRWWADDELIHTVVLDSLEPERLPPGRFLEHVIELEGAARVDSVVLASSTKELQAV